MPRELDPEWVWRLRFWSSLWKVILFVAIGVAFGAYIIWIQLAYL